LNIRTFLSRSVLTPIGAQSFGMLAILAGLTALAPLSIDSILPAIPTFVAELGATPAQAQWTISFFLLGFGGGQLVWGVLADRFGRRPIALVGLFLFALATLGSVFSPTIGVMTVLRVLQGLAGAAMSVIPRAIIRDLFDRETGARILSYVLLLMNMAPVLAPILGGYLLVLAGWQSIFIITGAVTVLVAIAFILRVPETLEPDQRRPLRPMAVLTAYGWVMRNRICMANMGLVAFGFSGFFAYLTGSPLVFVDIYGYSESEYGYLFALTAGSLMIANIANSRLLGRFSSARMLAVGVGIAAIGGIAVAVVTVAGIHSIWAFMGSIKLYDFGVGLIFPNAVAAGLEPVGALAGTAASLMGGVQLLAGTFVSALVAKLYDGTTNAIGITMALMALCVFLIHRFGLPKAVQPSAQGE
jgi:DHA1 family bicyclomycin/chloramphenicol resistance-like MFS transporter